MKNYLILTVCMLFTASANASVLNIAHRGASAIAPENTLAAINAAAGYADWVEFDIRSTADGQLVLMHDSTVDRTTDGTGSISTLDYDPGITSLDASYSFPAYSPEPVPTLAEAITASLSGGMLPLIEHKAGSATQYNDALMGLNVVNQVVVQSFDWNFLATLHTLNPNIELAALGTGTLDQTKITSILNAGASTVAWRGTDLTTEAQALAKTNGLDVFVWTINSNYQTWIDRGVDGIITDQPATLAALIPEPGTACILLALGCGLFHRRR